MNHVENTIAYRDMVRALAKPGSDIVAELTPEMAHLWHMASALMGEAGELFDAIKKGVIYGKPLNMENIIEELGDIEFYLEGLRDRLSIARWETLDANQKKLAERYASRVYSNVQAQARADKQSVPPETLRAIHQAQAMQNAAWETDKRKTAPIPRAPGSMPTML